MILGIESSCDDSSVALIDEETLEQIYYKKISQEEEHAIFGGVVPELAARLHTKALPALLNDILPNLKDINAIAVTNEPGLSVSLIGGVSMAKSLSIALNTPLIAVNHLVGHIYSLFLDREATFPLGVLLVSGGHTMILEISENGEILELASTSDDSFGESFDKVAKMLDLGYPGVLWCSKMHFCVRIKRGLNLPSHFFTTNALNTAFQGLKTKSELKFQSLKLSRKKISQIFATPLKIRPVSTS
ncbi:tRNA (adenosine(37)-N6)-threonylcarbamoyltransferase complex transferase subunit TsaD [Campylobacter concisus]